MLLFCMNHLLAHIFEYRVHLEYKKSMQDKKQSVLMFHLDTWYHPKPIHPPSTIRNCIINTSESITEKNHEVYKY